MKIKCIFLLLIILIISLQSCNNKKLTEVVEVPLPRAEEKVTIGNPEDIKANEGAFKIQKLPYGYDALNPNIDVLTMELHYSKHYLAHTNALNNAVAGTEFEKLSIEEILTKLDVNDNNLKYNAGGYYNHTIYWESVIPKGIKIKNDTLANQISKDFGSFEIFKSQFCDAAKSHTGSGWTWLIVDKSGKLQVTATNNQDNPLMPDAVIKGIPILGIDLWEHAYYLNYYQKKKNYIDAFFKIINWEKVEERYEEIIKK